LKAEAPDVGTVVIAGFPEITTTHPNCRSCGHARTHPEIVHTLHELYRQNIEQRPLHAKMANVYEGAGIRAPTRPALMRHLKGHLTPSRISYTFNGVTGAPPEAPRGDDFETDYFEMRRLYGDMLALRRQFEKSMKARAAIAAAAATKAGVPGKSTSYDTLVMTKLHAESRQTLKTLHDMRNSERLTGTILVRHTELLLGMLSGPLGAAIRGVRDRLARGDTRESLVDGLNDILENDINALFVTLADQAVAQSKDRFKLH